MGGGGVLWREATGDLSGRTPAVHSLLRFTDTPCAPRRGGRCPGPLGTSEEQLAEDPCTSSVNMLTDGDADQQPGGQAPTGR